MNYEFFILNYENRTRPYQERKRVPGFCEVGKLPQLPNFLMPGTPEREGRMLWLKRWE